jgi:hydrogenase expression/formation protein HypD
MFKTLEGFRSRELVRKITRAIHEMAGNLPHPVKLMHVCGTHEQALRKHAIDTMLPSNVQIVSGPGCPVCVCPSRDIDEAQKLVQMENVILTTYGDMVKVPGTKNSLWGVKSGGGDVRICYGITDAIKIAETNPDKEVVFFSVGFETTSSGVAATLARGVPENFFILISHRLIPPALELLMGLGETYIDGFLCPGHVAAIIGAAPFKMFAEQYGMATVVAGFEPVDILAGTLMLVRQIVSNVPKCENQYKRVVSENGNKQALAIMDEVYNIIPVNWRGIGRVPHSGHELKSEFEHLDARKKFDVELDWEPRDVHPGCSCHLVMLGKVNPPECKLFGKSCVPNDPYGPCMVSSEGPCRIYYRYGKLRKI